MILKLTNINIIKESNFYIKIYDIKNNIVSTIILNNPTIILDINYGVYKLEFYCNNYLFDKVIIYHNKENQILYYTYNTRTNIPTNIKRFILYDYHYSNLKIERGNLLLKSIT